MAISFYYDGTVSKEVRDAFNETVNAVVEMGNFEIKPGDLISLQSKSTGEKRVFVVKGRWFNFVPDQNGEGLVSVVLGHPGDCDLPAE